MTPHCIAGDPMLQPKLPYDHHNIIYADDTMYPILDLPHIGDGKMGCIVPRYVTFTT